MQFDCPSPTTLPDLPVAECPFNMGQIVRFAAQLRQLGGAPMTAAAAKLKATWTPLVAADDETKVVFSPIFAGLTIPSSEAKVEGGGDNSTFKGLEDYVGENPVKVPFILSNTPPPLVQALRKFVQMSIPVVGAYRLTLALINEFGQMLMVTVTGGVAGIPVYNFRVGSRGSEGFGAKDKIPCDFSLPSDWDENLVTVTPSDFDPLTDF